MPESSPLKFIRDTLGAERREAKVYKLLTDRHSGSLVGRGAVAASAVERLDEDMRANRLLSRYAMRVGERAVNDLAEAIGISLLQMEEILDGPEPEPKAMLRDALLSLESQEISLMSLLEAHGDIKKVVEAIEDLPASAVLLKYLALYLTEVAFNFSADDVAVLGRVHIMRDDEPSSLVSRFMVYVRLLSGVHLELKVLRQHLIATMCAGFEPLRAKVEETAFLLPYELKKKVEPYVQAYFNPAERVHMNHGIQHMIRGLFAGRSDGDTEEEAWMGLELNKPHVVQLLIVV